MPRVVNITSRQPGACLRIVGGRMGMNDTWEIFARHVETWRNLTSPQKVGEGRKFPYFREILVGETVFWPDDIFAHLYYCLKTQLPSLTPNALPLKMDGWKMTFLFGMADFPGKC